MEDYKFVGIVPVFNELRIEVDEQTSLYCDSAAFKNAIRCFSLGFWGNIPANEWVMNDTFMVEGGPVRAKYRMEDGETLIILLEPGHGKAYAFRQDGRGDGNG